MYTVELNQVYLSKRMDGVRRIGFSMLLSRFVQACANLNDVSFRLRTALHWSRYPLRRLLLLYIAAERNSRKG